jgi:hypothetical protein
VISEARRCEEILESMKGNESVCCIHVDVEFCRGFRDKREIYRYINEHCKPINAMALDNVIKVVKLKVLKGLEKLSGIAQVVIIAKSRRIGIPLAIAISSKLKVFYVLTDTLTNCLDVDCAIQTVTTYIARTLGIEKLYELKLQYLWRGESITIKHRCLFNEQTLRVLLLNAILLALFISSLHTPQA